VRTPEPLPELCRRVRAALRALPPDARARLWFRHGAAIGWMSMAEDLPPGGRLYEGCRDDLDDLERDIDRERRRAAV
jgi:hypothetical protein